MTDTPPTEEKEFRVPESLLLALVNEAGCRPHHEVYQLINATAKLIHEQRQEDKPVIQRV